MIPEGMPLVIFLGRCFLVIAAIASTIFPLYYGISAPWFRHRLGWVVMLQALALALALDLKLVLTFFFDADSRSVLLWVNTGVVATIAFTSSCLIYLLWDIRRRARERSRHDRV